MQPVNQEGATSFVDRFLGVLKLDPFTWSDIKRDVSANGQAWMVVVAIGLISGITAARSLAQAALQWQASVQEISESDPELAAQLQQIDFSALDSPGSRVSMIVFSVFGAIISWLLFAALARWAARQFFGADPNAATSDEMRRLTGWSYAPALLNVLAFIPFVGTIISLIAAIWVLVTQVQAVKHGMNLTTGKAIGASVIAWILPGLIVALLICACLGILGLGGGVTTTTP